MRRTALLLLLAIVAPYYATGFQVPSSFGRSRKSTASRITELRVVPTSELLDQFPAATTAGGGAPYSSLLLAEESWRQYVPLVVSALVIIDILLGSPAANSVLGLVRDAEDTTDDGGDDPPPVVKTKGERVDSGELANEALEKARSALEWQQYKEDTKTAEDRMEEIRKKMDAQIQEFDDKSSDNE